MKILFFLIITFGLLSCTSIKQNSQEWHVIYPDTKDHNIVKIKGLYKSKKNYCTIINMNLMLIKKLLIIFIFSNYDPPPKLGQPVKVENHNF